MSIFSKLLVRLLQNFFWDNFNTFVVQKNFFRPRRIFYAARIFYEVQFFGKIVYFGWFLTDLDVLDRKFNVLRLNFTFHGHETKEINVLARKKYPHIKNNNLNEHLKDYFLTFWVALETDPSQHEKFSCKMAIIFVSDDHTFLGAKQPE